MDTLGLTRASQVQEFAEVIARRRGKDQPPTSVQLAAANH
jgi:hypothetical protein